MADPDSVRRSYDDLAETYAAQRSADDPSLDRLAAFLDGIEQPHVLDAGCGQGEPVLRRFAGTSRAVGLDFSAGQLALAAEHAPAAALVQGDMTRLPFATDAFDAVTALHSLIHVPLEDHRTVLGEFARVLRPGGLVLLTEGHEEWTGENPDWLGDGVAMAWEIAGRDATVEQLRDAGFELRAEWTVGDELADEPASKPFFLAELAGSPAE